MKVIAFIGPSGTGKSHKSFQIALEKNIEYIIDDGLLIKGNKIIAGVSAKKEPTIISAIRRALFLDKEHAENVKKAIKEHNPQKLLILGTSERMVETIVKNLDLPEISEKIYIEDVSTREEIELAKKIRTEQGKHVIPVPTFEVKRHFSGYLVDPLRLFRKKGKGKREVIEKSVVRPTYSYLGKYTISETVIIAITIHAAIKVKNICRVLKVVIEKDSEGIDVNLEVSIFYGNDILGPLKEVQKMVKKDVEYMTALNVLSVNVVAKELILRK